MMDRLSQERFEKLVTMAPHEVVGDDAAFLRARRTYMNDQEREKFASVLKEIPVVASSDSEPEVKLDRKAMMAEFKQLGLKFNVKLTSAQMKAMIDQAKFDKAAEAEQAEAKRIEEEAEAKKLEDEAKAAEEEKAELERKGHKGNFPAKEEGESGAIKVS